MNERDTEHRHRSLGATIDWLVDGAPTADQPQDLPAAEVARYVPEGLISRSPRVARGTDAEAEVFTLAELP